MKPKPLDYPENPLLVDVRYSRSPELFEVIYLNPITEKLELKYEDAIIDIWFLKKENRTNQYQIAQVKKEECYCVYCKPSQVAKVIAQEIGGEWETKYLNNKDFMKENDLKTMMCECPWVFKADFQPDAYFRLRWLFKYGDSYDVTKTTYAFMDIEVDVIDRVLDMRNLESAPQPINALSIILPHQKLCVLLVLGPRPRNLLHEKYHKLLDKQIEEYEWLTNNVDTFKKMIIEDDPDNKKYLEGYEVKIHIFDYYDEIKLIKTAFDYLNKYRPMFVLSWNAEFDDNYLVSRIRHLGYDPIDIIIPQEFKTKKLYYHKDRRKEATTKTCKDFMFSSTYYIMLCQMKNYAHIRKSQQEARSYALNAIGKKVAGIVKLSDTKSGTFREFAYTDFLKFLLYNVRDVVVQFAIEKCCNDCQSLVSMSNQFATAISKCFEETHIVRNAREYFFEQQGYVQASRLLIDEGIDTAFQGAFVADPALNAPTGQILNGKPINNIIVGASDADAKAYYPSNKMGANMDPMSLEYKNHIDNISFLNDEQAQQYLELLGKSKNPNIINGTAVNRSMNQEYTWVDSKSPPRHHATDMTGPINNAYKNDNILSVLYNWFNVPSVTDIFEMLDSEL